MEIRDDTGPSAKSIHVPKSAGVILGGTFALLGGLVFVVGVVWLARTALFVSRAHQVPGRIVETEQIRDADDGGSVYLPVYTFTDAKGVVHTQRSSSGGAEHAYAPGQRITVFYDDKKPKDSRIGSLWSIWIGPLCVTAFGVFAAGLTAIFLLAFTGAAPPAHPNMGREGYP